MKLDDFYLLYYIVVYDYIQKHKWRLVDELNIDEIVNKSFYEFFKKEKYILENHNYTNYLCKFAYNIMMNTYSYKRRYYSKNTALDYCYNVYDNTDLLSIIIEKEKKLLIKDALFSLKKVERNIVILYYFYHF